MKSIKRILSKAKLAINHPSDIKYCRKNTNNRYDIVLVSHESKKLGASILLLNIAKELKKQGKKICIISRTFGELNDEYSKVCTTHISTTKRDYKRTLRQLYNNGCNKAIINTVSCGDLVKISKEEDFLVLSLIHELKYVLETLKIKDRAIEMLSYSDEIIFSTSVAEKEILSYLKLKKSNNIKIKPQGIYYEKPTDETIKYYKEKLYDQYPNVKNKEVIIGVGNTTERKGFDLFVETAITMPEKYFLWCGRKEKYYEAVFNKLKIKPKNFIYLGMLNQQELAGLYSIADVLLMSSRKDTLPSIIMESLLFNVPVVGSKDSGGIVDIIDESNGYLTNNCNSKEFSGAINIVLKRNKNELLYKSIEKYSFENYVLFLINEINNL